jgi:hypothetical protein
MKDFDWLQVHINNGFKNSSVKATIKAVQTSKFSMTSFYVTSFICEVHAGPLSETAR